MSKVTRIWHAARLLVAAWFAFGVAAFASQAPILQPTSGPHSMADLNGNYLNPALLAIASQNKGPVAPSSPVVGMLWINDSVTPWPTSVFDGTNWVSIGVIDPTAHNWSMGATALPAFSGDIYTSAGSSVATISPNVVGYSKQGQSPANTIPCNNTGSTANKSDCSIAQIDTMLNSTIAPVWSNVTSPPTTLGGYGITDGQPLNSNLSALSANSTAGLWASTAVGSGSARTITGTSNEINVANGAGTSGNPTLSLPTALTFTGKTVTGGTLSGPTIAAGGATFAGSTSGTTVLAPAAVASGTLTLPAATDQLVGRATTDTLTNKTLTSPALTTPAIDSGGATFAGSTSGTTAVKASATASGTLTLPAVTDQLVGQATSDTLTNKTIDTAGPNTIKIAGTSLTATTGSGSVVLSTSPSLTTPALGTPSAITLTNATGLPISTGVTGLGTGVATALATPSSANLAAMMTDETGTGVLVFGTSPTLTTPNLGTPSAVTLTNGTGLPTTGLTGPLQAAQMPALTGDVTNTAGSLATTIGSGVVSNSKLATMAASSIKCNNTGSVASAIDCTVAQLKTLLAITTSDVTNSVVPTTCSGTDKISSIASNGTVTCTADVGASGSGTPLSINGTSSASANLNDTSPAAPTNGLNVKWQRTAGSPDSISAYVPNAVQGPGSSTDKGIVTWNGTTGATLQSNTPTIDASGQFKPIAGTTTAAPSVIPSGTLNTTAQAGGVEYDGTCLYFSMAASSRGCVAAAQSIRLASNYTLTSQTAAQKLFNSTTNGALTVPTGVAMNFECVYALSSISATSGSYGFALGGTATITQAWFASASKTTALATAATNTTFITYNSAANTKLTAANTNTTGAAMIKGVVTVTTGGTIIPQVSLTVAAAAVVQAGSYCSFTPIAPSGTAAVGNWN